MHFALICPPLTGHIKPLAAIAAELEARGHRATFVHLAGARPLVEGHGATFAALPGGTLAEHKGVAGTVREMARQTDTLCRGAPALLRDLGIDAVIADQLEPGGALVAEKLGLPWITAACALPINRDPAVPPPYVGWRYDPSHKGRKWAEGGWRVSDFLMRRLFKVIEQHSEGRRRTLDDCLSPLLQIAQAVPAIDFPREALPPSFHSLGPWRRGPAETFDPPGRSDRPLVYCSLGTLQGGRVQLFARIAAACADLGLRLVLTHNGRLSHREVESLPGRPYVFDYLPQEAVLEKADLVVTHAGFNTVLEALSCGLPMVALPIAFDQPAVGARIRHAGVGEVVKPNRLRAAIEKVLHEPRYRAAARRVQAQIASAGGVARAADLIEETLRARS